MSEAWRWLGQGATVLLPAGVVAAVALLLVDETSPVRLALRAYDNRLRYDLDFLRATIRSKAVIAGQAAAVLAVTSVSLLGQMPWLLAGIVPVVIGPRLWLERRRARRVLALDEQLDGWLLVLANALKAGASLGEALESSVELVQSPMSEEVERVVKAYALGTPLDRALDEMGERVGSRAMIGALATLQVARNTGGDLPATLETAAKTLREIARLEGVVRTKTAEGKAQAFVISAIPAPLIAFIQWASPGYLDPLVTSATGHLIVVVASLLWVVAIVLASKIVQVEV